MVPMKEDLLKCKKIERSQWEFFQDCKSEKGSGREGGNRREKKTKERSRRGEDDEAVREKEGRRSRDRSHCIRDVLL